MAFSAFSLSNFLLRFYKNYTKNYCLYNFVFLLIIIFPDYVTVHTVQTVPKECTKCRSNVFKLLLSITCWRVIATHNDKVAVCLSCYVYIFAILSNLATVKQSSTIFFSKNYVSLERPPLDKAKTGIKPLKN